MLPAHHHSSASDDVRAVLSGLRARRHQTQGDRALATEVHDLFERSAVPAVEGLHFYVFEGTVSVYGAVATYPQRDAVVEALSLVPGIGQIADHLTVLS